MVVLSFLEMDKDRQIEIVNGGKLEHFITKGVSLNYNSSTSPYYRTYKKRKHTELYDVHSDDDEEWRLAYHNKCECVNEAMDEMFWYSKTLIHEKYFVGLTYQQMNQKYNISLNALVRDVKEGLEFIKQKCK